MEKISLKSIQSGESCIRRGHFLVWFVFFAQIPFVFWYAKGTTTLHPIVIMLPLVGRLNFKVEKRGWEGIGLRGVQPVRSLFLALVFAALSAIGWIIGLRLNSSKLCIPAVTIETIWDLGKSFLVGMFIIALWEEFVNRGYIQTRLQASWGFWGVFVTSLLFAAMHIPSTLLDYDNDDLQASLRFLETGLAGFALGFVYWRTRSVLTTIAIHGLNNFASSPLFLLGGVAHQQLSFNQLVFQLPRMIGQILIMLLLCRILFKERDGLRCQGQIYAPPC
jgi:membrane protease YdiL (CAAX protease family)